MTTTRKTTTRKTTTAKATRKAPAAKKTTARKTSTAKAPAKKTTAKAKTTEVAPKTKVQIQYYIDGRPTGTVDRLSRIAFFFTKGCNPGDPGRMGVGELRDYLAKHGVTDPEASDYSVELPNGKTLSAKVGVSEPLVRAPRSSTGRAEKTPEEKAAAADAKAKATLATIEVMKKAAAKVKVAGRNTGPDKIEVTRENAEALLAMTPAKLKAFKVETPAREATPITKESQTRRPARRSRKTSAKVPTNLDELTATA